MATEMIERKMKLSAAVVATSIALVIGGCAAGRESVESEETAEAGIEQTGESTYTEETIAEIEIISESEETRTSEGFSENVVESAGSAETEAETEAEAETEEALPDPEDIITAPAGTYVDPADIDMDRISDYFTAEEIVEGDEVYQRIYGKSYVDNDNVALSDLRYIKVLHYDFDHNIKVGEIIVNKAVSDDIRMIFGELFYSEYEINSMHLIDDYWTGDGDSSDYASIDVNNTSAFCYREVTGGGNLSNHAYGLAVDLNPQQNPYVSTRADGSLSWAHSNADEYIDRSSGLAHVITHEDKAFQVFSEHGFTWGGDWNNPKDYQHFEKRIRN